MRGALVFLPLVISCSREAPDLREWRPSDHDHTQTPNANQVAPGSDAGRPSMAKMLGVEEVVLTTWRTQCVTCHGLIGQGDGPQGAAVKARSFSEPGWQGSVTDEALVASIRNGKGAMPAFPTLPETTVVGLVKLIRRMAPQSPPPTSDAAAPDAAP